MKRYMAHFVCCVLLLAGWSAPKANAQAAEARHRLRDRRFHRRRRGHVTDAALGAAAARADRLDGLGEARGIDVDGVDVGALGGEELRRRAAEARCRAGDEDRSTLET